MTQITEPTDNISIFAYCDHVSFGRLASAISQSRPVEPYLGGFQTRDLAQITDDLIAWQTSGFSTDGLSLPPVFSAVRLIASTIDQLGITVEGGGTAPLWLRSPRRFGSSLDIGDIVQWIVSSLALNGSAYLRVIRAGESWRIDALHPGSVQARVSSSGVVALDFLLDGNPIPQVPAFMAEWQDGKPYLLWIPYLVTPQHPQGASPITICRESINGYYAVERQAATLLGNGTYSGGRLETDQDITPQTAERYQERWIANRQSGKLPVLGAGLRYVNDLISPTDAQWLESRAFNAQSICAMFGIPADVLGLSLMGGQSSLSYSNAQDNNDRFRRNCLEAFTTQIEDAFSQLMPLGRSDQEAQSIVFDYSGWEARNADAGIPQPVGP